MQLWEQAEADFETYWSKFGKQVCLHKFTDTKEVKGKLMRAGHRGATGSLTKAQPSDYLIVSAGFTFFAEVKSTSSKSGFALSALQPGQIRYARKVTAAGGSYKLFIKSEHLKQWYKIEYLDLMTLLGTRKSVKWAELSKYLTGL